MMEMNGTMAVDNDDKKPRLSDRVNAVCDEYYGDRQRDPILRRLYSMDAVRLVLKYDKFDRNSTDLSNGWVKIQNLCVSRSVQSKLAVDPTSSFMRLKGATYRKYCRALGADRDMAVKCMILIWLPIYDAISAAINSVNGEKNSSMFTVSMNGVTKGKIEHPSNHSEIMQIMDLVYHLDLNGDDYTPALLRVTPKIDNVSRLLDESKVELTRCLLDLKTVVDRYPSGWFNLKLDHFYRASDWGRKPMIDSVESSGDDKDIDTYAYDGSFDFGSYVGFGSVSNKQARPGKNDKWASRHPERMRFNERNMVLEYCLNMGDVDLLRFYADLISEDANSIKKCYEGMSAVPGSMNWSKELRRSYCAKKACYLNWSRLSVPMLMDLRKERGSLPISVFYQDVFDMGLGKLAVDDSNRKLNILSPEAKIPMPSDESMNVYEDYLKHCLPDKVAKHRLEWLENVNRKYHLLEPSTRD